MTKIELKNISKKFDDEYVLKNVNITFEEGKIYGIIGRNGSGKTVLLNMICGFIKPTDGYLIIDNVDIFKEKVFPNNIRALIEHPKFLENLSGYKNLELLAEITKTIGKNEIIKTLKDVNLYEQKDKIYKKYSLGMKQKLGIAQVLMENPKILILDEPFSCLDDDTINKIRKILKEEKKKKKIIIITTHLKEDINELCDIVYKVDNGKIKKIN